MKNKVCKNENCQKMLPDGYKHKYCENCRNAKIKQVKDLCAALGSVAILIGGSAATIFFKKK